MDRKRAGYLEGLVSIFVNILLFGLKLWAGVVSGSIALKADAWHTLSDSISSFIVILGVRLSSKKPDKDHPFGHGRWEQIAAIFIGVLLGFIAYDFVKDSIVHFRGRDAADFGVLAIVVTIISIVLKEALAQYAFFVARKTDNSSVRADGWHHRTDALSSVVVLVGILFARRLWWIDSALGFVIAFMLIYAAYQIIRDAVNKLLGETPDEELMEKIETIIHDLYPENVEPHHYHIHNYISSKELTFHIRVENTMNIVDAHEIATRIETKIKDELDIVPTIHIEPKDINHELE